ncbi:hypothetical protein BDZ85DRAFT_129069 [Elsinoe ampelina]|uniref:Uncharacterized protein n=1 Tax=Elsinoe ampelina TaxID=302913 RepID=A0A6A6GAE7_9PEZI|nr:hypothetical protein BDZ85DRAFT_129069 [Elsinoe ampelina]
MHASALTYPSFQASVFHAPRTPMVSDAGLFPSSVSFDIGNSGLNSKGVTAFRVNCHLCLNLSHAGPRTEGLRSDAGGDERVNTVDNRRGICSSERGLLVEHCLPFGGMWNRLASRVIESAGTCFCFGFTLRLELLLLLFLLHHLLQVFFALSLSSSQGTNVWYLWRVEITACGEHRQSIRCRGGKYFWGLDSTSLHVPRLLSSEC